MRSHGQVRRALVFGAIFAVALLLNVLVIAPAFHHHGPMHDAHSCPICTTHATGSIAPPAGAELPRPALTPLHPADPQTARLHRETTSTILVRGPPAAMSDLI